MSTSQQQQQQQNKNTQQQQQHPQFNRSSSEVSFNSTQSSTSTIEMGSGSNLSQNSQSGTLTQSNVDLQRSASISSKKSVSGGASGDQSSPIVLQGPIKKLKNKKRKWFVLWRDDNKGCIARLEYYDNEKKFKARATQPKKKFILKTSIVTRRLDTKYKFVMNVQTKEENFAVIMESEIDLKKWLTSCWAVQRGEDISADLPKLPFEHVWQVQVQKKGLAEEKGIIGSYNVYLTEKALSLIRIGSPITLTGEARLSCVEFLLMTIRRCGSTQVYFYLEVGRHSAIGSGELWMETADAVIAENMHTIIISAMTESSKTRDEFTITPITRYRSSSATESSKPIPMHQTRQSPYAANKANTSFSPTTESPSASLSTASSTTSTSTLTQIPHSKSEISKDPPISHPTPSNCNSSQPQPESFHHVLSASCCAPPTSTSNFNTPAISRTSCNPQYPTTAPLRPLGSSLRRHSVSVTTATSCHQRAFSLPSGPITFNGNLNQSQSSNVGSGGVGSGGVHGIGVGGGIMTMHPQSTQHHVAVQPIHQRTRSLPLTEETAIQISSNSCSSSSSVTASSSLSSASRCACHFYNKLGNHNKSCSSYLSSTTLLQPLSNATSSASGVPNNNNNYISSNSSCNNSEMNNNREKMKSMVGKMPSSSSTSSTPSITSSSHQIANSMDSIIEDGPVSSSSSSCYENQDPTFSIIRSLTKMTPGNNVNVVGIKNTSGTSPLALRRCRNTNTTSWSTLGRERCDSEPSRNRTASESSNISLHSAMMPPPRIPNPHRPHSIPSGTCSESDGSSLSIDEPDGLHSMVTDDNMSRYISSLPGTTIPEENVDDNFWYNDMKPNYEKSSVTANNKTNTSLSLPISQSQSFNQRKGSPAPRIGSMEGSNYMEMYSPCGSSPGDPNAAYLPMSPVIDFSRSIYTGSSGAHSRASSLAEETINGYVQMCPQQSEEYVDMDQSRHHHHHPTNSMSSAASSCSITSGTPSTDMRFAEYHLDKVSSRFTPDDEDTSSITERPTRAYSVGSRLEHNKRKFRGDLLNQDVLNSRERAFSVGSRVKLMRSDLYRGVLTPSAQENVIPAKITSEIKGKKSTSAPILTSTKTHTSIDPMEDLMEIDYSREEKSCTTTPVGSEGSVTSGSKQSDSEKPFNDLMEIDFSEKRPHRISSTPVKTSLPVPVPNNRRYEKSNTSPKINSNFSEYVEMRPQIHASDPMKISQKARQDEGYMNMRPVGVSSLSKSPSLSSSPIKTMAAPKTVPLTAATFSTAAYGKTSNYMDTSSKSLDKIQHYTQEEKSNFTGSSKPNSDDYLNMRPGSSSAQQQHQSKTDDHLPKTISAPEGYMEMSWGKESRNLSNSSSINNNNNNNEKPPVTEDYINVNPTQQESRLTSSLPIAIQNRNNHMHSHNESTQTIVTATRSIPKNQKESLYFNMAATSTNKSTTSKPSGQVTPSDSQATIFPFSPSSPVKKVDPLEAAIPTNRRFNDRLLSEQDEIEFDKQTEIDNAASTPMLEDLSNNYADMSLGAPNLMKKKPVNLVLGSSKSVDCPDYANCAPLEIKSTTLKVLTPKPSAVADPKVAGDYAFVDPTKKIQPTFASSDAAATAIPIKKSVLVTVNNNREKLPQFGGFKPICSSNTDELLVRNNNYFNKSGSPKPNVTSALNRHLSEKRASEEMTETCGGYEILQVRNENKKFVLSRPNSVNSEKISGCTSVSAPNRPNSANSERFPFVSTSSSTSTLCGSSSTSSSTLCGSKCHSPSSAGTSCPQSLSDIASARTDADSKMMSRPPSVSSDHELHYASLDLPVTPIALRMDTDDGSGKLQLTPGGISEASSSACPSPNPAVPRPGGAFTYAQIDFAKCELIKNKQSTKSN